MENRYARYFNNTSKVRDLAFLHTSAQRRPVEMATYLCCAFSYTQKTLENIFLCYKLRISMDFKNFKLGEKSASVSLRCIGIPSIVYTHVYVNIVYVLYILCWAQILKHLLEAEKSTFRGELTFQRLESTAGLTVATILCVLYFKDFSVLTVWTNKTR
jgi:hypothetical protein